MNYIFGLRSATNYEGIEVCGNKRFVRCVCKALDLISGEDLIPLIKKQSRVIQQVIFSRRRTPIAPPRKFFHRLWLDEFSCRVSSLSLASYIVKQCQYHQMYFALPPWARLFGSLVQVELASWQSQIHFLRSVDSENELASSLELHLKHFRNQSFSIGLIRWLEHSC